MEASFPHLSLKKILFWHGFVSLVEYNRFQTKISRIFFFILSLSHSHFRFLLCSETVKKDFVLFWMNGSRARKNRIHASKKEIEGCWRDNTFSIGSGEYLALSSHCTVVKTHLSLPPLLFWWSWPCHVHFHITSCVLCTILIVEH